MPKSLSRRELIRKLKGLGFQGPFSGGKHQFMQRGERKVRVLNPHGSGDVAAGLVKESRFASKELTDRLSGCRIDSLTHF